jgi:molybdopterin-guanine dinucleotide biosynthesis protein B
MTDHKQPVMGIMGRSGSGKTTLLSDLIPILTKRGLSVSTVKHTHHGFDVDKPGKDSYRHREAGAKEVLLTSANRWALLHEVGEDKEPDMQDMIARMSPVDVVLVEGFKKHDFPKIEVFRPSTGNGLLGGGDQSVVAIATDDQTHLSLRNVQCRLLDLDNIEVIADFIVDYLKL